MAFTPDVYTTAEVKAGAGIIQQIRKHNGAIEPAAAAYLQENWPDSLEAIKNSRRTVGRLTQLLSKNLYAKSTRFMFELIQNADDNQYAEAEARGDIPWVSLTLTPEAFELDCNEDGFGKENVWAVCKVAESTKNAEKAAQGYIGEKGIGFKSVFRVYQKAHIQSGPFAFSFFYEPENGEEAGLDLVTPITEDHKQLPPRVRTRVNLSSPHGSTFEQLCDDLSKIPDTILLFLNRIRQLEIRIKDRAGTETSVRYTRGEHNEDTTSITQVKTTGGRTREILKKYLLERRFVTDLPVHDTRKNIHAANVILAFPVTESDVPVFEQQHVFAFLPLQQAGFNFLIQSDFITNAARELIDDGCDRNRRLLEEVAQAFKSAIKKFASSKGPASLRHSWMGYLPTEDTERDQFWKSLRPRILQLLRDERVVRTWNGMLRAPPNLRDLPTQMIDNDGHPLLYDTVPETYLSPNYSQRAVQQLRALGVAPFEGSSFVRRLRSYVGSDSWKLRAPSTSNEWLGSFSACLCHLLKTPALRKDIAAMPLIRLQSDKWTSGTTSTCYWPELQDTLVPQELGIDLVHPEPVRVNTEYRRLLEMLGVKNCTVDFVVSRIAETYRDSDMPSIFLTNLVAHQHFLFKFAPSRTDIRLPIVANDDYAKLSDPESRSDHIYFQHSTDEFGPEKLLGPTSTVSQRLTILFINSCYQDNLNLDQTNSLGQSWTAWLEDRCGVRSFVQVLTPNGSALSPEFVDLLQHQQEVALQLLKTNWLRYRTAGATIRSLLLDRHVLTESSLSSAKLNTLYAPLPRLRQEANLVGAPDSLFLKLPTVKEGDEAEWKFLTEFGVRFSLGRDFFLRVLTQAIVKDATLPEFGHVLEIYRSLSRLAKRSNNVLTEIQEKLEDRQLIYRPAANGQGAKWIKAEKSRWTGSNLLNLSHFLLTGVSGYKDDSDLKFFFKDILQLADASSADYIEELVCLRDAGLAGKETYSKVAQIYKILDVSPVEAHTQQAFRTDKLIYLYNEQKWVSSAECVWVEEHVRLDEMFGISDLYPKHDLDTFFRDVLQIDAPSVRAYVNTLVKAAREARPSDELKQHMRRISVLRPSKGDVQTLHSAPIFSIQNANNTTQMAAPKDDFVIFDRDDHRNMFCNKLSSLRFDLIDVHRCDDLLVALDLTHRLSSKAVIERTKATDPHLDPHLTQSLRFKTEPLLRCALAYNQSADQIKLKLLLTRLQAIRAFCSSRITKFVELEQGGEIYKSDPQPAAFHIDDSSSTLLLYVPDEGPERERCFHNELAVGLLKQMGITNPAAKAQIVTILTAKYPETIPDTLNKAGIPELPKDLKVLVDSIPQSQDEPVPSIEIEEPPSPDIADEFEKLSLGTPESDRSSPYRSETPSTPPSIATFSGNWARRTVPLSQGNHRSRSSSSPSPDPSRGYASILDRIIKIANRESIASSPLSWTTFFQLFPERNINRDMSVGVAGEVYVLEYLQKQGIPDFGIQNWHSNIRTRAQVHPKYRNIGTTADAEIADFIYADSTGALTEMLRTQGALPEEVDIAGDVEYFLEVKTTTGDCGAEFYMSQYQVERMEDMTIQHGVQISKVYIIARVFYIDRENIGLKFFVDPQRFRAVNHAARISGWPSERLNFSVDKWTVKADA